MTFRPATNTSSSSFRSASDILIEKYQNKPKEPTTLQKVGNVIGAATNTPFLGDVVQKGVDNTKQFVTGVATALDTRGQRVKKDIEKGASSTSTPIDSMKSGLNIAGEIAGGVGDIFGEGIKLIPGAEKALQNVTEEILSRKNPTGQTNRETIQAFSKIAESNPETARALGSVFNILTLGGGSASKQPIKTAVSETIPSFIETTAQNITKKTAANAAKKSANFVENLLTPEMSTKTTAEAIKTGKVIEGTGMLGKRNLTEAIPNFDKIKSTVETVPGISSKKTALENVNLIYDEIANVANSLDSQLQNKGSFTPKEFNKYLGDIKKTLSESPLIVGDAEKTATKIINKFNALVKENGYTPSGLLKSRKSLDSWLSSQKSNVFNPTNESAVSVAMKAIRQGGNDFLAQRVPNVAVKEMLARQSNLYKAIEIIAPKAAKEGSSKFSRATGFIQRNPVVKYGVGTAIAGGAGGAAINAITN